MSRVDVIIPCYKYAHYLRACVASALDQPGVDVRVLILDDASPDDTPQVGRELAAGDNRVEYRRHDANKGHIATYNEGIEWAGGDYLLLLSADDMLTRGALGRAVAIMDSNPDVVLACGKEVRAPEFTFDQVPEPAQYGAKIVVGDEFWRLSSAEARNLVPTPSAVVRTATQKLVGGYRPDLPHSGDMEMWLRLAAHGSVAFIDVPQAFYRVHGQNMSTHYVGLRDIQQKKAAFDAVAKLADRWPDGQRILARADRAMSEMAFWRGSDLVDEGALDASRPYLDLAVEICPQIRSSWAWRKMRLKQLLGPRLWGGVRPLVEWVRHRRTESLA